MALLIRKSGEKLIGRPDAQHKLHQRDHVKFPEIQWQQR